MSTNMSEEKVAWGLGLIGGGLFLIGALVALVVATVDAAGGRYFGAAGAMSEVVLLAIFGGLAIFFSHLGRHDWSDRPLTAGLLLLMVALLGAMTISFGANVLALAGAVFVALASVLYLIGPMRHAASVVVTA